MLILSLEQKFKATLWIMSVLNLASRPKTVNMLLNRVISLVSSSLVLVVALWPTCFVLAGYQTDQTDKSARIFRSRGFIAREYKIVTDDSTVLTIVRATNPLFNQGKHGLKGRQPVIYLQGTTLASALVLENSQHVRPKDFSHLDANKLSKEQLLDQIGSDPSARNFLFLALNFGHEAWILNRRGFAGSVQRVQDKNRTLFDALKSIPMSFFNSKDSGGISSFGGNVPGRPIKATGLSVLNKRSSSSFDANEWITEELRQQLADTQSLDEKIQSLLVNPFPFMNLQLFKDQTYKQNFIDSFNPEFWKFTLDEQAKYDVPAAIDFVLKKTGRRKVHLVGFSCGGALVLMSQAENPDLAAKIGASILWAPSVNLGSGTDVIFQLSEISPFLQTIEGPIPLLFLNKPIQTISKEICTENAITFKLCQFVYHSIFGFSGDQAPLGPLWWANSFVSTNGNELRHLGQMAHTNVTCKYNFNSPEKNLEVYGQPQAPCYDFSKIKTPNLFFYTSENDRLVSAEDVKATLGQLSVNYKLEHIKEDNIYFNHLGYTMHNENARLTVVPSLKDMAYVEANEQFE